MQRVTLVRYTAKAGRADENESLARAVFTELRSTAPRNICYALFRNGPDFVHLFVNSKQDDAGVLVELPAFKAYTEQIADRCEAPPEVIRLGANLLESVGFPAQG